MQIYICCLLVIIYHCVNYIRLYVTSQTKLIYAFQTYRTLQFVFHYVTK